MRKWTSSWGWHTIQMSSEPPLKLMLFKYAGGLLWKDKPLSYCDLLLLVDIVVNPPWRKTVDHLTCHVTSIPGRACFRPVSCTQTSPRLTAWLSAVYCSHSCWRTTEQPQCYKGQGHRKQRSSKVILRWLKGWWVRCLKMWSSLFWRDMKRLLEVKHKDQYKPLIFMYLFHVLPLMNDSH